MFEGLDMNALLAQAQQMQADLARAQEQAAITQYHGAAGGDLVGVTVTGTGDLVAVDIKPEAWDPEEPETLSALIVAAFRAAKEQADQAAQASLPQIPGGFGFPS